MKRLVVALCILGVFCAAPVLAEANDTSSSTAYVFGNDACEPCRNAIKFLFDEGINYTYSDIGTDDNARTLYIALLQKHEIGEVLPLTVVGEAVIVGFESKQTTGAALRTAYYAADESDSKTVEEHIARAPRLTPEEPEACRGLDCDTTTSQVVYQIPFLGTVDINTVAPSRLTALIAFNQLFSAMGVGVLLLLAGMLVFASTKKHMAILAATFMVVEMIVLFYFFNGGWRTHDSFLLPAALAKMLGETVGGLWQQGYILLYGLVLLLDEALLLILAVVSVSYLQKLEDARPGSLGVLGTTLVFFAGVIIVYRLYFV